MDRRLQKKKKKKTSNCLCICLPTGVMGGCWSSDVFPLGSHFTPPTSKNLGLLGEKPPLDRELSSVTVIAEKELLRNRFCSHCGSALHSGHNTSRFCSKCGAAVPHTTPSVLSSSTASSSALQPPNPAPECVPPEIVETTHLLQQQQLTTPGVLTWQRRAQSEPQPKITRQNNVAKNNNKSLPVSQLQHTQNVNKGKQYGMYSIEYIEWKQ